MSHNQKSDPGGRGLSGLQIRLPSGRLADDLDIMLRRRHLLAMMGGSSAAFLAACSGGGSSSDTTTSTGSTGGGSGNSGGGSSGGSSSGACVSYSEETNGPYPADGSNNANGAVANVLIDSGIIRSDMTTSFAGMSGTAAGVALEMTLTIVDTSNSCAALEGYAVYAWHCNAIGEYSVYDLADQNYLRAVGITDANGQVTFQTIYPGCYPGRWPHIHFEVYESESAATHYSNRVLCSQIAMPTSESSYVYSVRTDYGNSSTNFANIPSIYSDNVFGDNSDDEIEAQTMNLTGDDTNGYEGTVTIGL